MQIPRGQKQNFAIRPRFAFAFRRFCRLDEDGGTGFIPACKVVKIGILPIRLKHRPRFIGGKKIATPPLSFSAK